MQSGSEKWLEMADKKLGQDFVILTSVTFVLLAAICCVADLIQSFSILRYLKNFVFTLSALAIIAALVLAYFWFKLIRDFFCYRFWFLDVSKHAYHGYTIYQYITMPQVKIFIILTLSIIIASQLPRGKETPIIDFFKNALYSLVVLYSLYYLFKSARQLVIGEFKVSKVGDKVEGEKKIEINISSLLHSRLQSLATLFSVVDTALPQKTTDKSEKRMQTHVSAFGTSALFEEIIQSEISIKTKVIEIPVSAFLKIMRVVFRKPQITGKLQKMDDLYILTAQSSGRIKYSWRVLSTDFGVSWIEGKRYASVEHILDKERNKIKEPESEELLIYSMVEQLATRIYTDLGNVGSKRWQAVDHFINGIRYYRHTLTENTNNDIYLRRAEKEFFNAWQDDMTFDQCYYNLAIIHRALKQEKAACELLETTKNQKHIPSLYAYAEMNYMNYMQDYSPSKYIEAEKSCQQIIKHSQLHAAAFHLLASLIKEIYHLCLPDCQSKKECQKIYSQKINRYHRTASAIAWKQLCFNSRPRMREKLIQHAYDYANFDDLPVQQNKKDILKKHHLNLVGIFLAANGENQPTKEEEKEKVNKNRTVQAQFKEVLENPIDGEARYRLGQCYEKQGRYDAADVEYDIAFVIDKDVPKKYNLGATYFNRILQMLPLAEHLETREKVVEKILKYISYLKHDLESARAVSYYEQDAKYEEKIAHYHYWLGRFYKLLAELVKKVESNKEPQAKEQSQVNQADNKNSEEKDQQNKDKAQPQTQGSDKTQSKLTLESSAEYQSRANHYFYKAARLSDDKEIHYFYGQILVKAMKVDLPIKEILKNKKRSFQDIPFFIKQPQLSSYPKAAIVLSEYNSKKEYISDTRYYWALSLLESNRNVNEIEFELDSNYPLNSYCYALEKLNKIWNLLHEKKRLEEYATTLDKKLKDEKDKDEQKKLKNDIKNNKKSLKKIKEQLGQKDADLQNIETKFKEIVADIKSPNIYFHLFRIALAQKDHEKIDEYFIKAQEENTFSPHYNEMFKLKQEFEQNDD